MRIWLAAGITVVLRGFDEPSTQVQTVLEQEFSDGWTSDGRMGFFHPDAWTFGQALHRSAIEGRLQAIVGVEHVVRITMKRFTSPLPALPHAEVLEMAFDEVLLESAARGTAWR